jgi:hypothetical protein
MNRLDQVVLIGSFVGFSWLAMQAVHELGHVLGAVATGGQVVHVALHPCSISRTDVYPNPHPLAVVWAGPLAGVLFPLAAWLLARATRVPGDYLFRFFAGFCLVANGVYIGLAALIGVADAGDMLRHGSPLWQPLAYGLLTAPLGFWLWHGVGPKFGLGHAEGRVSRSAARVSLLLLALMLCLGLVIDSL